MSSRNVYLSADERAAAPTLHRVLKLCAEKIAEGHVDRDDPERGPRGDRRAAALRSTIWKRATPRRWRRSQSIKDGPVRLLVAAKLGKTRLIDNVGV